LSFPFFTHNKKVYERMKDEAKRMNDAWGEQNGSRMGVNQ
jgi:hypothetical protein